MRWYILRTLLHKELLRNLANRGGLVLAALLVVMAMLLSFFGKERARATTRLVGGVQLCYVDYWEDGPWIEHLKNSVPPDLKDRVKFRPSRDLPIVNNEVAYELGTGAIQIRPGETREARYKVMSWYYGEDPTVLAPFEEWFWKESRRYFTHQINLALTGTGSQDITVTLEGLKENGPWEESHRYFRAQAAKALADASPVPAIDVERAPLRSRGGLDMSAVLAAALVLFALFFANVYLLSSLTCEERERGILLAQALSPASPGEILAAKFIFYPAVGVGLAAILAGIYQPSVLLRPFLWIALTTSAVGSMGIGLSIATLARTQRAASMGAMCYLMVVAMMLLICQQTNVPVLQYLFLEYHCPRMIEGIFAGTTPWPNLLGAAALALGWGMLAMQLFRRRGWQ